MRVARRPRSLPLRFRGGWRGDVMARELGGKHVVVVGATGGVGARIAAHLAAAGARVSAIVRDHTRLDGASVFERRHGLSRWFGRPGGGRRVL